MHHENDRVISTMHPRSLHTWSCKNIKKNPRSNPWLYASAGIISLATAAAIITNPTSAVQVMSRLDSGFDYDETLGRLQYVSNILPESAMVFLSKNEDSTSLSLPINSDITHTWTEKEPWTEFSGQNSEVLSCQDGEVAAVIKNREGKYTIRILHANGYESVYSGLGNICVHEHDIVDSKEIIGTSNGLSAFEIRKNGLSIYPVFDL